MRSGALRTRAEPKRLGESAIGTCLLLTLLAVVAFVATYTTVRAIYSSPEELQPDGSDESSFKGVGIAGPEEEPDFCRGIFHMELWGDSVKWGATNLVDTPEECCTQCRNLCPPGREDCVCNSWVYCGDKELCGSVHKQCWLKKQEDVLKPQIHSTSVNSGWTSGIIHPHNEGIIVLETNEGSIRIRLKPNWAPQTVAYIRDVVSLRRCAGCQFYRGEGLGSGWDSQGRRISSHPPGPPYALLQGTLHADGVPFKGIELESAPLVKRGHVCLIDKGPDFFISLGDHPEWGNSHTVFGEVFSEDMKVAGQLANRPTKAATWDTVEVREFEEPLDFMVKRWKSSSTK